jgi:hypothetical protein
VGDTVVLEAVHLIAPPYSPEAATAEVAAWMRRRGVLEVVGDRFAGELPRDAFRRHGLQYRVSDLDTSAVYLELLVLVNSGRVRLLDHPELLRQLRGLERMRGRGGQDRVDHRRGAHDDLATAAAQAIVQAARGLQRHCLVCDEAECGGLHLIALGGPPRPRHRAGGHPPAPDVWADAIEPTWSPADADSELSVVVGLVVTSDSDAAAVAMTRDPADDLEVLLRHTAGSRVSVAAAVRTWAQAFRIEAVHATGVAEPYPFAVHQSVAALRAAGLPVDMIGDGGAVHAWTRCRERLQAGRVVLFTVPTLPESTVALLGEPRLTLGRLSRLSLIFDGVGLGLREGRRRLRARLGRDPSITEQGREEFHGVAATSTAPHAPTASASARCVERMTSRATTRTMETPRRSPMMPKTPTSSKKPKTPRRPAWSRPRPVDVTVTVHPAPPRTLADLTVKKGTMR